MGFFADFMQGRAMRDNPALLQDYLSQQQADRDQALRDSMQADRTRYMTDMMGQRATPQQMESQTRMTEGPMVPGQSRDPMTVNQVTQEAQQGQGVLGGQMDPQELSMRMAMAPTKDLRQIGSGLMSQQFKPPSTSGVSTFETGVEGSPSMKQRMYFDKGQATPVGGPYRAYAPQAPSSFQEKMAALEDPKRKETAVLALRDPYLKTETAFVDPVSNRRISRDVVEGKIQEGYGTSVSQRLEGYNDYVKQSHSAEYELSRNIENLDNLLGATDNWTTGVGGAFLSYIPMTDAQGWEEQKSTVLSSLALDKMMELKAASPTGSTGFGALSERELEVLQKHIASLKQSMKPSEIRRNIARIKTHLTKIRSNVTNDRDKSSKWYDRNSAIQSPNREGRYSQQDGPKAGLGWK